MAVFHSCDSDGIVSQMRSNRAFTFALTNFSWLRNGVKKNIDGDAATGGAVFAHGSHDSQHTTHNSHVCFRAGRLH